MSSNPLTLFHCDRPPCFLRCECLKHSPCFNARFSKCTFFSPWLLMMLLLFFFFQIIIVIILLGSSYPLLLTSQGEMISHVFLPETMNNILSSRFFPPPGNIFPFRFFFFFTLKYMITFSAYITETYSANAPIQNHSGSFFFSLSISYAFPSLLLSRTHYIYSPLYFSVVLNWTVLPL